MVMRRSIALVMTVLVLCSFTIPAAYAATSNVTITVDGEHENKPETPSGGSDNSGDDYYLRPSISVEKGVAENGYMVGRPGFVFDADKPLTRAEFAVIVDRVFVFDDEKITKRFEDVKGHWAEEAICRLASNGVVAGVSSMEFDPDGTLKRDQVLLVLSRLIYTNKYSTVYSKIDLSNHYAKKTIAQMLNAGVYTSLSSGFDVSAVISRGEMVHLVNNIIYMRDADVSSFERYLVKNKLFQDLTGDREYVYYRDCLKSLNKEYVYDRSGNR